MNQVIRLWIDDAREMPEDFTHWAKTAQEAKQLIATSEVVFISFDHDLGDLNTCGSGYDVACFIEELIFYDRIPMPEWTIHSANPVGRQNIERAMRSAERFFKTINQYEKL